MTHENQDVIFLGNTGVLWSEKFRAENPEAHALSNDPEAITLAKKLAYTASASIVATSSDRYAGESLDDTKQFYDFSEEDKEFQNLIIDQTPNLYDRYESDRDLRGHEVAEWLRQHSQIHNYVIIDHRPRSSYLPDQRAHYVKTNMDVGLTPEHCEQALKILHS